jgi:hypothetical protein
VDGWVKVEVEIVVVSSVKRIPCKSLFHQRACHPFEQQRYFTNFCTKSSGGNDGEFPPLFSETL